MHDALAPAASLCWQARAYVHFAQLEDAAAVPSAFTAEWQRQQKSQPCPGWTFHRCHTRCCHNNSSFSAVPQDENTRYVDIGPVNKTINTLACWFENPDGEPFKRCALALVEVLRSLGSVPSITNLVEARVSCG